MTPYEHVRLSAKLARALGWKKLEVRPTLFGYSCYVLLENGNWREFDYQAPDVCLPLIKWLLAEHSAVIYNDDHGSFVHHSPEFDKCSENSLEEVVARTAIVVKGTK